MLNKIFKTKSNLDKVIGNLFHDYSRTDLGLMNNIIRYLIYFILIMDVLVITFTGIVGFKVMNAFGPVSTGTGLGFSMEGLALELFVLFVLLVITYNIVKEKVQRKRLDLK